MKGFTKAIKRTPHLVTSKVGFSKKSSDPEFDDYNRHFAALEQSTEKLLKDTKGFCEAVITLFTAGHGFANHFSAIFTPLGSEYSLQSKHPDCAATFENTPPYATQMEELRSAVSPELELIESRIMAPVKEFQGVLKTIRKCITKREHKLVDYDRYNNSLTKLRDKKEKSLSDEKNLFKLEQDFENATNEYDYINNQLKSDLPRFMQLATQFIDPLFHSFFYMQLNVYYLMLEKVNSFAEGKYDVTNVPGSQISNDYEEKRSDAWSTIEEMGITKRILSTSKLVQQNRANGGGGSSLGRSTSTATASSAASSSRGMPPSRAAPSFIKKAPPQPPGSKAAPAPPPPYSAGENGASMAAAAATKRAPPPPPIKPKPKMEPPKEYVTALYDFDAQADGDLSFKTGDRIEILKKTDSQEDWWTGRVNGQEGVFPGNYVQ
ncbi:BAR-domain-containing protein [Coniophora puteana RWD-64-598 SS2]|uniref:BAR-domain-containing protein n=1 Tax=Coniophora puteana (strain RWD-64-598) TaxID=741705 RepID=A0A5M3N4I7_CONPW|nr:BAR-domain-containing protein [Coniophora puteana RWD-64-598 SS2]EIW86340.1 BAR-domain-containing protein [Coniophora puteana RWD-64-598 SS2]